MKRGIDMNTLVRKLVGEKMYHVTVIRDKNDKYGNPIFRVNVYDNTGVNVNDEVTRILGLRSNAFGLRVQSYDITKSVDTIVNSIGVDR